LKIVGEKRTHSRGDRGDVLKLGEKTKKEEKTEKGLKTVGGRNVKWDKFVKA